MISCQGWHQEAALRMLMNNLDPEVAEKPDELIVYGGTGRAARDWASFQAIVRSLRSLSNDETLLVQSGKPVGIFRTHDAAPRVLIANSNLVGHWSNYEEFHRLERLGLIMYGQMTAGSWIYIGSQGIVQGTFETFAAAAVKHFDGSLRGKLIVSGGMGGMGGAQPLAATLNDACFLGIDVDPARIQKRLATGYCDRMSTNLDEALDLAERRTPSWPRALGRPGGQLRRRASRDWSRRGIVPDILTDQTSAHDALNGYVPNGMTLEDALRPALLESGRIHAPLLRRHGRARPRHARLETHRRGDVRLRQQHPRASQKGRRRRRVRNSRLRSRIHPPAVLRRPRPVPLGCAFG